MSPSTLLSPLALFLIVAAMPIIANADPVQPDQEQLHVVMEFERVSNSYYLTLTNNSSDSLCLSAEQLDTGKGAITLQDSAGKPVPLRSYREMGPPLLSLKFNFAKPYIFLQPEQARKMYIDAGNFIVNASVYSYDVVFSYYLCRDIIDLTRIGAQKDIPGRSLHAHGSINMGLGRK
jgi:hypothetical protein